MNEGKEFEKDIKQSFESVTKQRNYQTVNRFWLYRPSDFGGGMAERFTNHSLCDFIVFDKIDRTLYLLELKSIKSTSISCPSFETISELNEQSKILKVMTKEEKEKFKELNKKANTHDIKYHQIKSLMPYSIIEDNIISLFIINFRKYNKTYLIAPCDLYTSLQETKKSSINIEDIKNHHGLLIPQSQIRKTKHYNYDVMRIINREVNKDET